MGFKVFDEKSETWIEIDNSILQLSIGDDYLCRISLPNLKKAVNQFNSHRK